MENLGGETPAKEFFLHFMDKNAENRIFLPRPGEKREESRMGLHFYLRFPGSCGIIGKTMPVAGKPAAPRAAQVSSGRPRPSKPLENEVLRYGEKPGKAQRPPASRGPAARISLPGATPLPKPCGPDGPSTACTSSGGERSGALQALVKKAKEAGATIKEADPKKLDYLCGGANHQGWWPLPR